MPILFRRELAGAFATAVAAGLLLPGAASAGDTADLRTWSGRKKILLWPIDHATRSTAEPGTSITIGDWDYRSIRSARPRDGVPWELQVSPSGKNAAAWKKGATRQVLPGLAAERGRGQKEIKNPEAIPVIELPDTLWKKWLSAEMDDVVGIHYHAMVTDDQARILYTLHQVPPDLPDGTPEGGEIIGTRIEATLLAPVAYSLDQTVVVRMDPHDRSLVKQRGEHELSHAEVSQQVLVAVLHGPQDWDERSRRGRRSQIEYYWKREQVARSWQGFRAGLGKASALRTTIVLVPPTRWSMLLPIPPERVTQKHIQQFNDAIVLLAETFAATDRAAQERFHAQHGAFEQAPPGQ